MPDKPIGEIVEDINNLLNQNALDKVSVEVVTKTYTPQGKTTYQKHFSLSNKLTTEKKQDVEREVDIFLDKNPQYQGHKQYIIQLLEPRRYDGELTVLLQKALSTKPQSRYYGYSTKEPSPEDPGTTLAVSPQPSSQSDGTIAVNSTNVEQSSDTQVSTSQDHRQASGFNINPNLSPEDQIKEAHILITHEIQELRAQQKKLGYKDPEIAKQIEEKRRLYNNLLNQNLSPQEKINHVKQHYNLDKYQEYQPVRTDIIVASDQELPALTQDDLASGDLEAKLLAMGYTPESISRLANEIKARYYDEKTRQWADPQSQQAYENAIAKYNESRSYLENPQTHNQAQATINAHHANPRLLTFSEDGLPTPLAAAIAAEQTLKYKQPDIYQDHALSHYMTDNAPNLQSARRLWGQNFSRVKNLFSRGQGGSLVNHSGKFVVGSKNSISRLGNALKGVKTLSSKITQAPKTLAAKGLAKLATKLGIKGLAGAATGGIATVIMLIPDIIGLLRRHWKKILPGYIGFYSLLSLLNPLTWIALGWKAVTNWVTGGASGTAAAEASALGISVQPPSVGTVTHAAVTGTGQEVTALQNSFTGDYIGTYTQQVSYSPSTSIMTTSTPFLLTTAVGPFILVFVLALIVMTHLLTSFTVPNPLQAQFGATDTSGIPGLPPQQPGPGTGPSQPDNNADAPQALKTIIQQAAENACLPAAYLTAVLQVEAGGIFSYSDEPKPELNGMSQLAFFDSDNWWVDAGCYNSNNTTGICGRGPTGGYCYNTCATPGLCAPNSDVRGAAQFRGQTFYGHGSCVHPQGLGPTCSPPGSPSQYVSSVRNDPNYTANRCRLSDALYASAYKLSRDSSTPFGSGYSCDYNPARWDPQTSKASICLAARAYCGSCGAIENPSHQSHGTGQPCEEFYRKPGESGYGSAACGGSNSLGHCNMVYNYYVQNLN